MLIEAIKLSLAGLMVILDVVGVGNSNAAVLNLAKMVGWQDIYQVQTQAQKNTVFSLPQILIPKQIPYAVDELSYPIIEASSAIVIDSDTGAVLYAKNADEQRAMASVTKMMTAIVTLDNSNLTEEVTIEASDTQIEPNVMNLFTGERITIGSLVEGLLIGSNNDAALALARIGGNGDPAKFIEKMNQKAKDLGLNNTHFTNPHGLDEEGLYSSAKDLAMLAKYAMNNPTFAQLVATKETDVQSSDGSFNHHLTTTNKLLDSYLDIKGVKTGFTDNAGQVLVSEVAGNKGQKVICVVMNSPDRFQESKVILDWALNNFDWE